MGRIFRIALWFGLFASLLFALAHYLTRDISNLPFWGDTLSAFDEELSAYRATNPALPQTVIVGPSYAAGLGHIEYIYNLGLGTTSFQEHRAIIKKYVRPHDLVLYVITMREAFPRDPIIRREIQSRPARQSTLLKMKMRRAFKLAPYLESEAAIRFTPIEALAVEQATGLRLVPSLMSHIVRGFYRWGSVEEISIEPLEHIYEDHPRILFVMSPTIRLSRVSADTEIGATINRYIANREHFMELIAGSDLPILDLSHALPKQVFYDFVHMTPEGKEIVKQQLLVAASRLNAARTRTETPKR